MSKHCHNLNIFQIKLDLIIDMHKLIGLLLLFNIVNARYDVYNGYSTYQVVVKDMNQLSKVNGIEDQLALDVWSPALPGRPGTVLVPRDKSNSFEDALYNAGIRFKVEVENIKQLIDLEQKLLRVADNYTRNASYPELPFDRIHDYYKVTEYIEDLARKYPELVKIVTGGKSYEGKPIKYLKISTTDFKDPSKPIIFIQSLLHAREWITLPASLYAIQKLVVDVTEYDVQQNIDWIILPIVNPDGYIETHTDYRFWRKNKSRTHYKCVGVDLNRNFGHNWGQYSSPDNCHETYHGTGAFSEPESRIVRDIVLQYWKQLKLYIDLHSFGSKILYPYGDASAPAHVNKIHNMGIIIANAIDGVKVKDYPNYEVGNAAMLLYYASGTTQDYVNFVGVPYSYTIELPGYRFANTSENGFLVEPKFIKQAGYETWQGIVAGARRILKTSERRRKSGKTLTKY